MRHGASSRSAERGNGLVSRRGTWDGRTREKSKVAIHGSRPREKSMETPDREWDRVARDLRSYRKEQRRQWGDVDEALIARYLTGGCTPDEKLKVERARREFPRVN